MKSPFPGMDPYLEARWGDVHQSLITVTEGYIEIRERGGGKVITVIEFLSPANKAGGEGQKLYLQKQRELLHSDTNFVEIDLVRSGQRVIAFPEHRIPPQHRRDSLVCVRCAWSERGRALYA